MPAMLSLHLPDQPALLRVLDEAVAETILGRGDGSTLDVPHASVSRRHAALQFDGLSWWIEDLGSTNGVRISGHPVIRKQLEHDDWFSLGDVFCEFRLMEDVDLRALSARAQQRRQSSGLWLGRLQQAPDRDALLAGLIAAIVQLAECGRGFLLAGDRSRGFVTVACYDVRPESPGQPAFTGSSSAITRAVDSRKPVLVSDPSVLDWARGRPSIIAGGLRALVALPIAHHDRLLGVAYADSAEPGKVFTELDLEILGAFMEQAGLLLAARGLDEDLSRIESCVEADAEGKACASRQASRWKKISQT